MAGGNLDPSARLFSGTPAKKLNNISVQVLPFCPPMLHSRYGGVNTGEEKESLEGWEGSLRHICVAHGITPLWHLPRLPPLSIFLTPALVWHSGYLNRKQTFAPESILRLNLTMNTPPKFQNLTKKAEVNVSPEICNMVLKKAPQAGGSKLAILTLYFC